MLCGSKGQMFHWKQLPPFHNLPLWKCRQRVSPQRRLLSAVLHGVMFKKEVIFILRQFVWCITIVQINHQPDATIFQFIIQTFIYISTCFGRFLAHHQELNDCSSSLWFCLRVGYITNHPTNHPTTNTAQLLPRYEGKTIGCYCRYWAPDDGRENFRNMLSCK